MKIAKQQLVNFIRKFGYEIVKQEKYKSLQEKYKALEQKANFSKEQFSYEMNKALAYLYADFTEEENLIINKVKPYTRTTPERIISLTHAVEYIVKEGIPGDIVECGVWKGGSMMAVAHSLIKLDDTSRGLFLYDTFEGMSEPTEKDVAYTGVDAGSLLDSSLKEDTASVWCYSPLEEVSNLMHSTGYNTDKIYFIQGKVEETIPATVPKQIALLRLDTDWYESTKHELIHLFPLLTPGGVIIIDDYGHWKGARMAVDEYFLENNIKILLNRIDYTARIGVKY